MYALALLLLGIVPHEFIDRERVDLIELNHFYDEQGRLVFDQVIFYDWSKDDARYMVRAWRLVKNPLAIPKRDWKNGGYSWTWNDGEAIIADVKAGEVRESWTQHDPELSERDFLPKERRREFDGVHKPKRRLYENDGRTP